MKLKCTYIYRNVPSVGRRIRYLLGYYNETTQILGVHKVPGFAYLGTHICKLPRIIMFRHSVQDY
jgi:hypothetical protein